MFGQNLIKCIRCPVAFHKQCLGCVSQDGPRGKWLCYFCKVMKVGIEQHAEVTSLPAEKRVISELFSMTKQGWRDIAAKIKDIVLEYKCSGEFSIDDCKDWDDFLSKFVERVPSNGGSKAYFVLRLFEALISTEHVRG